MKVAVIGGGVIGFTTAWQLAKDGHEVTLLERSAEAAGGTSHENGAQLSWSHAVPMAAPGMMRFVLANFWRRDSAVTIAPWVIFAQTGWLLRAWQECAPDRHAGNRRRMAALARYSLSCLEGLCAETGIDHQGRSEGMLQVFRRPETLARHKAGLSAMQATGLDVDLVQTPDEIVQIEPSLAPTAEALAGALLFRGQGSGDCRLFTQALAQLGQKGGITLRLGAWVTGLRTEQGSLRAVRIAGSEDLTADLAVICTGSATEGLMTGFRHLPIVPVRGRSLSLGVTDPKRTPSRSIIDEDSRLSIAPLSGQVRLAGFADLVGRSIRQRPWQTDTLRQAYANLFPASGKDDPELSRWTGFRPVTPDGAPMIGPSAIQGLWLNLGHGGYGWTMAAGSARLLADMIAGRPPAVPAADYAPTR